MSEPVCRICGAATEPAGEKRGALSPRIYLLRHCPTCRFSFIANPWTEFDKIYTVDYYEGRGADPYVDYGFELDAPDKTIRQYEWAGLLRLVESHTTITPDTQWLDFGCGNGGLVRYVRERRPCPIVGFDEGHIRDRAVAMGIPFLERDNLAQMTEQYDIITAIEVFEHVDNPNEVFQLLHRLLKPGGLLVFTTGNAQPFRGRLAQWGYVIPEIHISFYEPETLVRALGAAGFQTTRLGFQPGFADIIRFKVLKQLKIRAINPVERLLPWPLMARVVDARLHVTAHPTAWAVKP